MWRKTGGMMGMVGVLLALSVSAAQAASATEPEQLSSPTASLTISKITTSSAGEDNTSFSFGGSLGDFRLADGESVTFAGLEAGSYTVVEILPAGWQFGGVTCLGVEAQVSAADAAMTVTLEQGQPAACTFQNYREQVAGPELPQTGSEAFTMPLLIAGLWTLLIGLALVVWPLRQEADEA
jgi:LPXTG-motif cell wall-anchored protein